MRRLEDIYGKKKTIVTREGDTLQIEDLDLKVKVLGEARKEMAEADIHLHLSQTNNTVNIGRPDLSEKEVLEIMEGWNITPKDLVPRKPITIDVATEEDKA